MQPVTRQKAERYARYRLPYADEAVLKLLERIGPNCRAALDIGAGPGSLTRHLVGRVPTVYAVEPEPEMLQVLRREVPTCTALQGFSDATGLPDQSVDLIVIGNAYHRFPPESTVAEFKRILRPGGWLANFGYQMHDQPFLDGMSQMFERFPEWGARMQAKRHARPLSYFYGIAAPERFSVRARYDETWEEYWGATISAIEAPSESDPWFPEFAEANRVLFDRLAPEGVWEVDYSTAVTLGQPAY